VISAQDLRNVGLQPDWNQPKVENQDGSTWISYTSQTGGDGGIEIGILEGGPDAEEMFMLEQLELGAQTKISLSGADAAGVNLKSKEPAVALIFRRGPSVVIIRIPRGPNAGEQLAALAALFIQRVPGTAVA